MPVAPPSKAWAPAGAGSHTGKISKAGWAKDNHIACWL